jgi:hypothetical protein
VLLKRLTKVLENRPVIADVHEVVQQQLGEAWTVLPGGTKPTVLSKGAMGIVVHL